ncbi:MAG: hypothetical protein U0K71_10045 [Paludibacteraceae bacterium]|nr:hypothetical protein [Paludibacteraceae bacterium]
MKKRNLGESKSSFSLGLSLILATKKASFLSKTDSIPISAHTAPTPSSKP